MVTRRLSSQVVVGAVIVLVGLALLLETTNVADTGQLLLYVPSLFVLVGLYALAASGFRNVAGPLTLVVVAGAWQLLALDVVAWGDVWQFWPLLVVAFGLSLLAGRYRARAAVAEGAVVSVFSLLGGREQRVRSKTFEGGDVTAVFGGAELDLRDAEVVARPARLDVTALFGGVEVVVPRDWNVALDVLPILAGASDERPRREEEHDDVDLVVTGFAAFGGVSIED